MLKLTEIKKKGNLFYIFINLYWFRINKWLCFYPQLLNNKEFEHAYLLLYYIGTSRIFTNVLSVALWYCFHGRIEIKCYARVLKINISYLDREKLQDFYNLRAWRIATYNGFPNNCFRIFIFKKHITLRKLKSICNIHI